MSVPDRSRAFPAEPGEEPWETAFASRLFDHAALRGRAGEMRPLWLADAVRDLLPLLPRRSRFELARAAGRCLAGMAPRALDSKWLRQLPREEAAVLYTRSLEEVLAGADLQEAARRMGRLLWILGSEEYAHALLLEAGALDPAPDGAGLVSAHVVVRELERRDRERSRDLLFRLIEALYLERIPPPPFLQAEDEPAPAYDGALRLLCRLDRDIRPEVLYLGHAARADGRARLKRSSFRREVRRFLSGRVPGYAALPEEPAPDLSDPPAPPLALAPSGERDGSVAGDAPLPEPTAPVEGDDPVPEALSPLPDALRSGDRARALACAEEIGGRPELIDPLVRIAAERTLPSLARGEIEALIHVNAMGWALRIARDARGELARRWIRDLLDAPPATEAPPGDPDASGRPAGADPAAPPADGGGA